MHKDLFALILAESSGHVRSSQALLEDEWEPEPIEALTGECSKNAD